MNHVRPVPSGDGPPRVGHIEFLNCLPLYWGLERIGALAHMRLHPDTPDRLSDLLVAGELDVGPISVVEALRHSDDLVVLPEVAVGADGPVLSVCLVSERPVVELAGATVALGSTSRTSVELARLLLEQRWGLAVSYVVAPPDAEAMLRDHDAGVLIGDPALRATLVDGPARGWHVTDLAAAWREWQGLPFVFAVWGARRGWAADHPEQLIEVRRAFAAALVEAAAHPDDVAKAGAARSGFSAEQLGVYFRLLDFGLGPRPLAGVAAFGDLLGAPTLRVLDAPKP